MFDVRLGLIGVGEGVRDCGASSEGRGEGLGEWDVFEVF